MGDTTYNGWTNYETWQANLWFGEYDYLGRLISDGIKEVCVDTLKDGMVGIMEEQYADGGVVADIVSAWFLMVNWQEIADSYNVDLEEEA